MQGHADDAARVEVLRAYDILDTPPDELFDQLTRLAAASLDMPIKLVSLIDEKRQWFKSRVGIEWTETDRQVAFCDHAIRDRDPVRLQFALRRPCCHRSTARPAPRPTLPATNGTLRAKRRTM